MSIPKNELENRCRRALELAERHEVDFLFVYYDEYNVMNGRYLTGWCPTIERGAVIISAYREPFLIGGPEAGPSARLDSGIKEVVSSQVFMVPEEEYPGAEILSFAQIAERYFAGARIRRIGLVGGNTIPHSIYSQLAAELSNAEIVDLTDEFETLRYVKSPWEREMVQKAYEIADISFQRLARGVRAGNKEYEAAAEAEYAARKAGADGFGYRTIVGSGERAIGIVPPATERVFQSGEMVVAGVAPRYNGYNATACAPVVVGGKPNKLQERMIEDVYQALLQTRDAIRPGLTGREIDRVPRDYLRKQGYGDYIPMPFVHSSGLSEFEKPFFGPSSDDVIQENQVLCIDIAMFGHPEVPGMRAETAYWVTAQGVERFSPYMERLFGC
ncbi:MAG: aminopeptidase P family protein [Spirochaetales bacterium]|nr:aminopeptidase P family protein [Spirochaetales bacterium]